ncbi:MAG: thiocillin family RiPP [Rhodoglobus sp.]|uniref:thiocillin family RiPP n=1 Tax=Pengzhenrongella phosphoraccumulans TaxID=3114394 RepID=UPI00388D6BBA
MPREIDLVGTEGAFDMELLPDANALGCFSSGTSASTASCPLTSASTLSTASTASA